MKSTHRLFLMILPLFATTVWANDGLTADNKGQVAAESDGDVKLSPKYPVEIICDNAELKKMLTEYLPLITYQQKEELDAEQIEFLLEDTPKNIQEILRTQGYFNAKTEIQPQGQGYRITVQAGEATHIDNVNIAIGGDVLQDKDLGSYYKEASTNWKLPVGSVFTQDGWSSSKTAVLTAVTRKKYPLAELSQSQATINPNNHQADLNVSIDSKQPIYFGDIEVSGNKRYPVSVAMGLAKFKAGDPYDLDQILDYQQALESNSHYSGASVQADFDHITADRIPVKVLLSEVQRQKFNAGISYDSEYGPGGNIGYDHYNVFNRGYIGSTYLEMDKYQTTASVGLSQPQKANGGFYTTNLAYTRSTTQKLEKRALSSGLWYVRNRNQFESRYGIEFIGEDAKIPSSTIILGRSFVTMLTAEWRKQNIETTMRPANGYYISAKVGSSLGSFLSSEMMARVKLGGGYYFTPENKKLGTVVLRGELGYVYTPDRYDVPSSLMFRTGGATSVRGYELDSIGVKDPSSDAVLPEKAVSVASVEYQIPIKNDFALALFHDVGGTGNTPNTIKYKHGTGIGVRWFSPMAPFSFDLAYGHQDKRLRWHISLGTRF